MPLLFPAGNRAATDTNGEKILKGKKEAVLLISALGQKREREKKRGAKYNNSPLFSVLIHRDYIPSIFCFNLYL